MTAISKKKERRRGLREKNTKNNKSKIKKMGKGG